MNGLIDTTAPYVNIFICYVQQLKHLFLIYHQTIASTWYKNTIILRVSNALSGFYKLLAFAQTVLPYIKISHFHSTLKVC